MKNNIHLIEVNPELNIPDYLKKNIFLSVDVKKNIFSELGGKWILKIKSNNENIVLCSLSDNGNINWAIDINLIIEENCNLIGRSPKQPIYTHIPFFNINRIPSKIRSFIFKKFFTFKIENVDFRYYSGIIKLTKIIEHLDKNERIFNIPKNNKPYFIITIDVDSDYIFTQPKNPLVSLLNKYNFKAAWFFLTKNIKEKKNFLNDLMQQGYEIGWHGFNHDHKIAFLSEKKIKYRIEKSKEFFYEYNVKGMRLNNFLWSKKIYKLLNGIIQYDTSFNDCFPFAERGEGCFTSLPFLMKYGLWQIPTTITGDFVLDFNLPFEKKNSFIKRQIDKQIELRGLIHIILHSEPEITLNKYNYFLAEKIFDYISQFSNNIIHCLPRELICEYIMKFTGNDRRLGSLSEPEIQERAN